MSSTISRDDRKFLNAPQIIDNVLAFPKIHFLQRIPDFDFLVFNHTTQVCNMRCGRLKWKVLLNLELESHLNRSVPDE